MNHEAETETTKSPTQPNEAWIPIITFVLVAALTAQCASWPEVYGFATDPHSSSLMRLIVAPVHLSDDVMVSLRSGYILNETGRPAFNRHDLAQASTSYLSPYLFALLLHLFPENIALGVYAFLGLVAVALTLSLLVIFSRSLVNALLLVVALALTKTNLAYALNGWDHLFQGLFLTLGTCIVLAVPASPTGMLVVSASLALGTLFRPDGLLISIGVLSSLYLSSKRAKHFIAFGLVPYVGLVATVLVVNLLQFDHLTPTTARLKLGAAPALGYIGRYLFDNGVLAYTALTLFVELLLFYVGLRRSLHELKHSSIVAACVVTAIVAAFNSDVFSGARMFWASACVMAAVIAVSAPALLVCNTKSPGMLVRASRIYTEDPRMVSVGLVLLGAGLAGGTLVAWPIVEKARGAVVSANAVHVSRTASQYVIARWIDTNLKPGDGPIGLFYLGVGYHLPRFEVADFLGKADELIAVSDVKWGPPGHNKWDIDKTLEKWKPQAIVPAAPSDPNRPGVKADARKALEERRDYGFWSALVTNDRLARDFSYCYVPSPREGISDEWGFFLRKDLAAGYLGRLTCS